MKTLVHWSELFQEWKRLCQAQFETKNRHGLSIGLELEFFLLNSKSNPVSLDESQLFLKELLSLYSSRGEVNVEEEILNGKKCLSRIKCPMGKLAWNSVGYEYPPHLLEVSLSYHPSLMTLEAELESFLQDATACATKLGLTISLQAVLTDGQKEEMEQIENVSQKALKQSRLEMLRSGPFKDDISAADFPAYLAATHFHIGGHAWWNESSFIDNLYRLESFCMLEASGIRFKERWDHYFKVFHDFELVGFPNVSKWTIEWWMEKLFDTSYQRQKNNLDNVYGLNKLRDLQIIRPRAIGTVEFRADAAQPTSKDVMRLAALRLGQFLLAQRELPEWVPSYQESRKIWYTQMLTDKDLNPEMKQTVLALIKQELRLRGLGEECLLDDEKVEMIA